MNTVGIILQKIKSFYYSRNQFIDKILDLHISKKENWIITIVQLRLRLFFCSFVILITSPAIVTV